MDYYIRKGARYFVWLNTSIGLNYVTNSKMIFNKSHGYMGHIESITSNYKWLI